MSKYDFVKLGKYIEEASISALNRAAQTAVTKASSFIREKYNFKKSELDQHIKIIKRANRGNPVVTVRVTNAEIGLIHFNAKQVGTGGRPNLGEKGKMKHINTKGKVVYRGQSKTGVTAMVVKGKSKLYRGKRYGAFIKTINGGKQVFIRTSSKKLPIKKLYGVSLTAMVRTKSGNSRVVDVMHDAFDEAYEKRFDHELKRRIK